MITLQKMKIHVFIVIESVTELNCFHVCTVNCFKCLVELSFIYSNKAMSSKAQH